MIPVSKFAEKDKFCMATYTPYVDMAVEIGDLFSKVTGNSWTDTDLWEGSTFGVNIAAWGSLISAALYSGAHKRSDANTLFSCGFYIC